eukprot:1182522-Prorocentrum_minimum.AAC.1
MQTPSPCKAGRSCVLPPAPEKQIYFGYGSRGAVLAGVAQGFDSDSVREALGIPCRFSIPLVVATGYANDPDQLSNIKGPRGEKRAKVGNWTQGEKRGRVSGVLRASLPLLAQEGPVESRALMRVTFLRPVAPRTHRIEHQPWYGKRVIATAVEDYVIGWLLLGWYSYSLCSTRESDAARKWARHGGMFCIRYGYIILVRHARACESDNPSRAICSKGRAGSPPRTCSSRITSATCTRASTRLSARRRTLPPPRAPPRHPRRTKTNRRVRVATSKYRVTVLIEVVPPSSLTIV